jgi:hypothetical protein
MAFIKGINPDAQQTINDFMVFKNVIERSILPLRQDVKRVVYADLAGRYFFPDRPDNPFTQLAESQSIGFMAYKGTKSNQFVDIVRTSPDLSALQTVPEEHRNLLDKMLGRGKE